MIKLLKINYIRNKIKKFNATKEFFDRSFNKIKEVTDHMVEAIKKINDLDVDFSKFSNKLQQNIMNHFLYQ